ncbi:MAG: heavy metal translocating P-type ATPase [Chloroflexi bacterium]|nr:heavy metal translocating P-type ATPase [Chloroflexota bacterium]
MGRARHLPGHISGLLALTIAATATGALLRVAGYLAAADAAWAAAAIAGLIPALVTIWDSARRRKPGVDVVAVLAVAGALLLGEFLAGAVIGVMLATGRALEGFAAARAERALSSLLARAPRTARRITATGVETISADEVRAGDVLAILGGDAIPVDGIITAGPATLDESALTGESRLAERPVGDVVRSGSINAGAPFQVRATSTAASSTYAGIIRLVSEAQRSRAPLVRLADRYAAFFVPLTLAMAGLAWAISGDPVRALAVLVVATPCPLLLAAPVAIISGVSRAAGRGIVIKGGAPLETLARAKALYFDKTGTLTMGAPRLGRVLVFDATTGENGLLRLAASLEQLSPHVLATALLRAAAERGLALSLPQAVEEHPGLGVEGVVDGHRVRLGTFGWVRGDSATAEELRRDRRATRQGGSLSYLSVDGALAGAVQLEDAIRPETARTIRAIKRLGITETRMLTGDHASIAEAVGAAIGVDGVLAGLSPAEKVEAVAESRRRQVTVMVGDGINDAPALAAADVGIAMGARGATSSSEAADVVLVVDRLDRLVEGLQIARRARFIAIESILLGMGLSFVAMAFALGGYLPPIAGAILQEGIDAVAILNALRVLAWQPASRGKGVPGEALAQLRVDHGALLPHVDSLQRTADMIDRLEGAGLLTRLNETQREINSTLLPHERDDERTLYPQIARALDGDDPLGAMSRTHQEVFHLAKSYDRLIEQVNGEADIDPEDIVDIRRVLYALHAVLRLNIAQEEELYVSLTDEA